MNRNFILIALALISIGNSQQAQWPTQVAKSYSSNFGENRDTHFHMGLDIRTQGKTGLEILAVEDGYISRMVSNFNGYGKALYQKTNSGHEVLYAHLSAFTPLLEKVWRIQQSKRRSYIVDANFNRREFQVMKGDVIGYSGNTGNSFGPHLHFEYRSSQGEPLNPLTHAFDLSDHVTPIPRELALIPISQEAQINGSPLVQTMPLFRDKSGVYFFADTVSVFGQFAFAIQAYDKREGANNIYQFQKTELFLDGKKIFELDYSKIPFSDSKGASTAIQYDLKRREKGEFQKLYVLEEHPKISIHALDRSGILNVLPGYHAVEIKIHDAVGNIATIQGSVVGTFPMELSATDIFQDNKVITLALSPKHGGLPIHDAVVYNFTPYGYPDQQIEIIHKEQVKKDLHITLPLAATQDRILQIIGLNQLGGTLSPHHWTNMTPKMSVTNVGASLQITSTERGIFFQFELDQYVDVDISFRLANDNTFKSYSLNQIGPITFLSELLPHRAVEGVQYIDLEMIKDGLTREKRFSFNGAIVGPGQSSFVISNDRNCSVQTMAGTFFQPNAIWIEKMNHAPEVHDGFQLSSVYQLQPFDVMLKGPFDVGIRYAKDLASHTKLGLYYFDPKGKEWIYTPSKNNQRKQIITTTMRHMNPITLIQDLDAPMIRSTFPANSGRYHKEDVSTIVIAVDDYISGVESDESSFDLLLDDIPVYFAYQPIKKEISYIFDTPLTKGQHKIDFKVRDRMGNEASETIYFSVF